MVTSVHRPRYFLQCYLDQLIRNGLFLDDGNINIGALQHSNAYVFETGLFIISSRQFLKLTNGPYMNKLSYVSTWFLPSAGRPRTTTLLSFSIILDLLHFFGFPPMLTLIWENQQPICYFWELWIISLKFLMIHRFS